MTWQQIHDPFGNMIISSDRHQSGRTRKPLCASHSAGGVRGKKIDARSIVAACTATGCFDQEGDTRRDRFSPSIALASLVGLCVTLQACVWPFTQTVLR